MLKNIHYYKKVSHSSVYINQPCDLVHSAGLLQPELAAHYKPDLVMKLIQTLRQGLVKSRFHILS